MKNLLLLLSIFVFIACGNTSEKETTPAFTSEAKPQDDIPNFGIVIHGGAGTILKENMSGLRKVMHFHEKHKFANEKRNVCCYISRTYY